MIVPKLKQRKDGNWTVRVDGKTLNLQTKVYSVARERAKEAAYEGKRDFSTDTSPFYQSTTAAPASDAATGAPAGDWQSDVADAVSAGLKPDAYFAPGLGPIPNLEDEGRIPTDAPHTADEKKPPGDGNSTEIPPDVMAGMMEQAASIIVEAQIQGQEWLIARALKRNAGPVPASNVGRTAATEFWKQQLAIWMPADVPLPPWAAAMVTCALFSLPQQLADSTPIVATPPDVASAAYPTAA